MTYRLIDTDTGQMVATAETEAAVLRHTTYLPSDCLDGAATWQDVVDAANEHPDGLLGYVECYKVEEYTIADMIADSGITTNDLARRLGVSRDTVASWRIDRSRPCCGYMERAVRDTLKRR